VFIQFDIRHLLVGTFFVPAENNDEARPIITVDLVAWLRKVGYNVEV